ncbi:hypothetical protein DFP72DRAFT_1168171 [Ephemerocybe angulata]|uniref:Fungal-type protein kinase domain-containing protein n=1 Tax=Ephemerocybe angulata TaxID=980116 RepID=A0A8H6I3M8_9AGAR|nr:hypothetical protein DFP72DRAFT_1168171 [Tulosesus angulatus]
MAFNKQSRPPSWPGTSGARFKTNATVVANKPLVEEDLRTAQRLPLVEMLKAMIMMKYVREDPLGKEKPLKRDELREYGDEQLDKLLEESVAFCNHDVRAKKLKDSIKTMMQASKETSRYHPLASALNSILCDFSARVVGDIPFSTEESTLFTVNDPVTLTSERLSEETRGNHRKPDLYEATWCDLFRAAPTAFQEKYNDPDQIPSIGEMAEAMEEDPEAWKAARKVPEFKPQWSEVITCIEVKVGNPKTPDVAGLSTPYSVAPLRAALAEEAEPVPHAVPSPQDVPVTSTHSGASTQSKRKRPLEEDRRDERLSSNNKKPKRRSTAVSSSKVDSSVQEPSSEKVFIQPHVQCAFYGIELLRAISDRTHAIVFLVDGPTFTLQWHDSQGALITNPINIITHLPLLVATVVLSQRFNSPMRGKAGIKLEANLEGRPVQYDLPKSAKARWELRGRRPVVGVPVPARTADNKQRSKRDVRGASSTPPEVCPVDLSQYHFKWSWREVTRDSEASIVKAARRRAEHYLKEHSTDVTDHLPQIMHDEDFPSLSTGLIRQLAELPSTEVQPRIPSLILSKQLLPLEGIDGYTIIGCIWDILRCLFLLWRLGVAHGDVSLGNIMMSHVPGLTKPRLVLVLNDFDLAALMTPGEKSPKKRGFDRTGTRPFVALDLLKSENGLVARLCRHDLESVIWVFPWYCDSDQELADWNDLIRKQAFRARWAWMTTTRVVKRGIPRDHAVVLSTSQKILRKWLPLEQESSEEYNYRPIDSEDEDDALGNGKADLGPTHDQHIPNTLDAETQELSDEAAELPDKHYLLLIAEHWQPKPRYMTWEWMDWEVMESDVLPEDIVPSEVKG